MGAGHDDSGVRKGILERFENSGGGAAASAYNRAQLLRLSFETFLLLPILIISYSNTKSAFT